MFHPQPYTSYAPQQPLNQQEMLDTQAAIEEALEDLDPHYIEPQYFGQFTTEPGPDVPF